jgi:hypothetical protein
MFLPTFSNLTETPDGWIVGVNRVSQVFGRQVVLPAEVTAFVAKNDEAAAPECADYPIPADNDAHGDDYCIDCGIRRIYRHSGQCIDCFDGAYAAAAPETDDVDDGPVWPSGGFGIAELIERRRARAAADETYETQEYVDDEGSLDDVDVPGMDDDETAAPERDDVDPFLPEPATAAEQAEIDRIHAAVRREIMTSPMAAAAQTAAPRVATAGDGRVWHLTADGRVTSCGRPVRAMVPAARIGQADCKSCRKTTTAAPEKGSAR